MPYDAQKKLQRFSVNGKRYAMAWPTEQEGAAWEALARLAIAKGQPIPGKDDAGMPGAPAVKRAALGGRDVGTLNNVLRTANRLRWEPKGGGARQQAMYAGIFVRWCGPNVGPREAFAQENCDRFIDYLKAERRVSNTTINKYNSAVRTLMEFAGIDRKEAATLPHYATPEGRVRFFSDDEKAMIERQWRLWQCEREADFFIFCCHTGARPYIDGRRLHWTNVFAPKRGPAAVHFIAAKGGNARTVPLTPEAYEAVQRQSKDQTGPWAWTDEWDMSRLWNKTRAAFPQLADAVFYCTRHTFGTELYRKSRDIKLVKDMMGHKNIKTTEIYVHVVGNDSYDRVAEMMSSRGLLAVDGGANVR